MKVHIKGSLLENLGDVSWVKSPLGEGVFYLAAFFRRVRKYI